LRAQQGRAPRLLTVVDPLTSSPKERVCRGRSCCTATVPRPVHEDAFHSTACVLSSDDATQDWGRDMLHAEQKETTRALDCSQSVVVAKGARMTAAHATQQHGQMRGGHSRWRYSPSMRRTHARHCARLLLGAAGRSAPTGATSPVADAAAAQDGAAATTAAAATKPQLVGLVQHGTAPRRQACRVVLRLPPSAHLLRAFQDGLLQLLDLRALKARRLGAVALADAPCGTRAADALVLARCGRTRRARCARHAGPAQAEA